VATGKAAEHPDDSRNESSAHGLDELAAFVRGLADDDERLIELGALGFRDGLWIPPSADAAGHAISRFRFDRRDQSCDLFLTQLVPLVGDDAIRQAQFADELPYPEDGY